MTEFTIRQTHGPIIRCEGRQLAEVCHRDTTARLLITARGNFIVWTVTSNDKNERDLVAAKVIDEASHHIELQVMDFLEWSSLARKLQRAMKWELAIYVE